MSEKRNFSDKEIQDRYLADLQKLIAEQKVENLEHTGLAYSGLEEVMEGCAWVWECANSIRFTLDEGIYGLTKRELEFFEKSAVVWSFATVSVREGKLTVEVTLLDEFEE